MSTSTATRLPGVPSLSWDDSRLLVESVVDYAIFMLDTEGRVATWNLGAAKIKGYTADEIVGQHFSKFYPVEDVAAGKPDLELEVATRLGRVEDEGWRIRKDGSRFWANVVITALRDEAHNLRGFGKVTRDLTERREAEALQRELVREQAGREAAEAAEARYRALSQRLEIVLEATVALGTSLVEGEMLSTLAGLLVPGLADWCSIYLLQGERLLDIASAHSHPERRAAREAYQRRYPPDPARAGGVWNVVRTGTPQVLNDLTDEVLARSTNDPEAQAMLRALGMTAALLAPIRVRTRIAGVIVLVSAESGRRYDMTDARLVEELGRRAGVALENAQLFGAAQDAARRAEDASRAKDEFLATVSHELRTPLGAILGWASLLKARTLDPSIAKPIEVIHRNAQAQVKIIDDILDVSRVITGKLRLEARPVDLISIARDAIEVVRPAADAKGIALEFMPAVEFCLLVADPDRLQQVVWNLLSNAVKFTDTGGAVRLSVSQEGSTVALRVADTGKGIEPSFLPHVFERFKQADSSTTRRVGGLGLGLALVRHIVELHGGDVAAHSDGVGKGAAFTVSLPVRAVIPSTPASPVPPIGTPTAYPLAGVRILVVDDEADARDLLATVLTQAGAAVKTAPSAAAGYEAFLSVPPDVLVSDIGMPGEDGFTFIRRIRALSPTAGGAVPAIALTAFAREEDRARALAAGFTTHLGKPVNPETLASGVAELATPKRRS
ncbi:MAG TPA: ATP-binding protein [Polyangiaceae bacterium]